MRRTFFSPSPQWTIKDILFIDKMNDEMENAIKTGNLPLVEKYLIADPNQLFLSNFFGASPVKLAVNSKEVEIAKLLISQGALKNPNDSVASLIETAIYHHDLPMVVMLLEYQIPDDGKYVDTPLHLAVRKNDLEIAKLLLEKNAAVNRYDKYGCMPIHHASSIEMVKLLLDYDSDINAKRDHTEYPALEHHYQHTLLHMSLAIDSVEFIEFILNRGANVYALDGEGNTIMHTAFTHYTTKFIFIFVEKFPDLLKIKNNNGDTPFMSFCRSGAYDPEGSALNLLELNCYLHEKNNALETALHLAVKRSFYRDHFLKALANKAQQIIDQQNKDGNTALHIACNQGDLNKINIFLEAGANINIYNNKGNTPLHEFIIIHFRPQNKDTDFVLKTIPLLQNFNKINHNNESLLYTLSEFGSLDCVKLLFQLNPTMDIDTVTNKGKTAAFIALAHGHLEVFEFLIQKGASLDLVKNTMMRTDKPNPMDNDAERALCKYKLCYPQQDKDKQFAIEIAMTSIAFTRWSQADNEDYANLEAAIQHLIEKFGEDNFIEACKKMFNRDLHCLDLTNIEKFGPHTDIEPYDTEIMRVAKLIIANKYHLVENMRDQGYYVNIKTLFGDSGLWKVFRDNHPNTYYQLLEDVKEWPAEIDSQSMYFTKKYHPIELFRSKFPKAYQLIQHDLNRENNPRSSLKF